jgi:hypothetical protein
VTEKKPNRRIALVLFGQPRFIQNHFAFLSHKWQLRKHNFDVFGHYWFQKHSNYEASAWTGLQKSRSLVPSNAPRIIRRAFPKGEFIASPPRVFKAPQTFKPVLSELESNLTLQREFNRLGSNPESMYSNTTSQLYSIHQALSAVSKKQQDYDLVILSRFDNLLLSLPNLETLVANKLYISNSHVFGFPDLVMIGSPKVIFATDAFSAVPEIYKEVPSMAAEKVKELHFLRHHFEREIERVDLRAAVVRGGLRWWLSFMLHNSGFATLISRWLPKWIRQYIPAFLSAPPR